MTTLYELLGVREDATDEELKRGYRRAAMKAHPDRNVGSEAHAHARFQEIKEAYAILSDPEQRRVYDEVYAEEMRRHREEEARLQAAREAEYARLVTLAMRFAEQGHNRDVVFGVLLGRDCDASLAERIAGSVVALHASRQPGAAQDAQRDETAAQAEAVHTETVRTETQSAQDGVQEPEAVSKAEAETATEPASKGDARKNHERAAADFFSTLWHSMFGLRP